MDIDILECIQKNLISLTKSETRLADFILANPHECAMISIMELSYRVNVSKATIVRFSKNLGYQGFQEVKSALKERVIDSLTASHRIRRTFNDLGGTQEKLSSFILNQQDYLKKAAEALNSKDFAAAAQKISGAACIYIYGDGAANTPAKALEFWLNRFGLKVQIITSSGRRLFDQIIHITQQDLFISFLFGKESHEVMLLLDYSKNLNITSIVITDLHLESIIQKAGIVIAVERGPLELFHSMSVPVVIAESLALAVGRERGVKAVNSARQLDETRKKYGLSK